MRNIFAGFLVCFIAGVSQAQSIGFLMEDADLVVAGETVSHGTSGRVDLYSLSGYEVIKGSLDQATFRIGCFCDVCCHVHLHEGKGSLMFLRRLTGDIDGVDCSIPLYTVLHGELGHINYDAEDESAIVGMARQHAAMPEGASEGEKAEAMAAIFKAALRLDSEPLLYSAAYDAVATPGTLERLDASDHSFALERFQNAQAASRLRGRMLLLLGEAAPAGFVPLLEDVVRSQEGRFYLDPSAAILSDIGDAGTGMRLVSGFANMDGTAQANILYVLGHMGGGKGLAALATLVNDFAEPLCAEMVDALVADRTDGAVNLLSEMTRHANPDVASPALAALGRINTRHARSVLQGIASSNNMDDTLVEQAVDLLKTLAE